MKPISQTRRADSFAGPAPPLFLLLLVLVFASTIVLGQKSEKTRVVDSILGVGVGASLDQAHAKLDRLSTRRMNDREEQETEEREGGRKEAWTLKTTDYVSVALQTDRYGRVVWITGFVRPGKEIAFAKLGDLSSAAGVTDSRVIWNVATPSGGYRLVAKGQDGKARVISLLSLAPSSVQ